MNGLISSIRRLFILPQRVKSNFYKKIIMQYDLYPNIRECHSYYNPMKKQSFGAMEFPLDHENYKNHSKSYGRSRMNFSPLFLGSIILTSNNSRLPDSDDELLEFSRIGNINGVKKYISKHYVKNVDTRHYLGWTSLMAAVINGHSEIAEYLIKSGADVNAQDDYSGHFNTAKRLGMNSGEVANRRVKEFCDFLKPNANFKGCTPLHYATLKNDTRIVKLLLEAGADPTKENERGHKALMYARQDNEELKLLLEDYEQKVLKVREEKEKEQRRKYPLEKRIKEHIVGQEAAIDIVASSIRRKENGWYDEEHPLVFLFLGSSGVGKTELAKQVAKYLHKNNDKSFIRIDMSEYQHKHEVAKFIGSPPGYIGHESGGQLTKALSECPNAVVLFDEVEKAHPDVLTALLQLFDEGRLTDGQGRTIVCKDAIFIMTSNVASEEIAEHAQSLRKAQEKAKQNNEMENSVEITREFKERIMRPILKAHFLRDEFLGRINEIVYFLPFSRSELTKLVSRELDVWKEKAKAKHKILLEWDRTLIDTLVDGYDIYYGARSLKYEVERRVIGKLALAHERSLIQPGCKIFLTSTESETMNKSDKTKPNRPDIKMVVIDANSSSQRVINLESEPIDL